MKNNYGILLPIEVTLPLDFVDGDDIASLLDKETRDELFRLANKTDDTELNISKIPFVKITNRSEPHQVMGYGSLEANDSGKGYLNINFTSHTIIYEFVINSEDESINLSVVRLQEE